MAICWTSALSNLDVDLVLAPERYSSKRFAQSAELLQSVALADIASLNRVTINTAQVDRRFLILDTTHAVEGKIICNNEPVEGREAGSVKRPLRAGNVIVSRLRPYLRQIALIDDVLLSRAAADAVCSTEFYVLESVDGRDIAFLVPYLLSASVQEIFKNSQEGGHHPRMHKSVLMELRVPLSLLEKRDELSTLVRKSIAATRMGEALSFECADKVSALV